LQGLGLKVDLLENGQSNDASKVIEEATRAVEHAKDDSVIYAQHAKKREDLSEEELEDIDESFAEIKEANDLERDDMDFEEEEEDDDSIDIGTEGNYEENDNEEEDF
jgi:hypothetical protein